MKKLETSSSSQPKIGLALGSGSARGLAHIGIIETLLEAGINIDIICGSSIGALVGGAYIAGKLDYLKKWALSLNRTKMIRLLDISMARGGIIKGNLITDFVREMYGDKHIPQYSLPFAAIATDLKTGREICLQEGPLYEAVRASISLPGIFTPIKIGNQWLLDGGLVNPVPVSACRALGAEIIIAVNLNSDIVGRQGKRSIIKQNKSQSRESPDGLLEKLSNQIPKGIREYASRRLPNLLRQSSDSLGYFDVLCNSIYIMQDRITRSRLAEDPPDVILMPRLAHFNLMNFNKAEEAIKEGCTCAEQSLPLIRKLLIESNFAL